MANFTTPLDQLVVGQAQPAVTANELFDALSQASIFGRRASTCSGLTWGYYGGRYRGLDIAVGTIVLPASETDIYLVAEKSTGTVSYDTTTVEWDDPNYDKLYWLETSATAVTDYEDAREFAFPNPRRLQIISAVHGFALVEANSTFLHPSADTTTRTWTIPSNASIPFAVNTELEFINQDSAGVLTIAITSDTLREAPGGATGSRSLADNGIAWARKVTATEWLIWGFGLT